MEPRANNFHFGDFGDVNIIEDRMTAYPRLDEMTACQITSPILNKLRSPEMRGNPLTLPVVKRRSLEKSMVYKSLGQLVMTEISL